MDRINFNSFKAIDFFDKLNPQSSGLVFSAFIHLIILLFAVGLPNFFGPKDIYVPNIVPIEILNVAETTSIENKDKNENASKKMQTKQKKFNSSDNTEIKKIDLKENIKNKSNEKEKKIITEQKIDEELQIRETLKVEEKKDIEIKTKVETIKTNEIKPKLKPKPKKINDKKTDIQIQPKNKKEEKPINDEIVTKPKNKPKEDFNIASMLKDLRNEKLNNPNLELNKEDDENQISENETNESMILSISEIDLLRQQLSSCWNAPAGAVIERGMMVTISAKIRQNMKVIENSVRIVDTNISKSNAFYGPITDSAMRTLLNPECTPLKLPKDKYNLWKNLTITFDYSIMKGL